MAVVAAHGSHIHLIEDSTYNICMHPWRIAQRVWHGVTLRGAPFNYEDIGIYKTRRRGNVHSGTEWCKIDNHIIVFDFERVEEQFCFIACKHLTCAWHPLACWQKRHIAG